MISGRAKRKIWAGHTLGAAEEEVGVGEEAEDREAEEGD